jgi:alpha-L-rhamnosidase
MLKGLKVTNLTCNYAKNPVGIDSKPRFSWQLESDVRGQYQSGYKIGVSSSKANLELCIFDLWDTGKVMKPESILVKYDGKELSPRTRYWWKVISYDCSGEEYESEAAFFETGKLNENWNANWITANFIKNEATAFASPYLRTTFEIDSPIVEARLYICGLGYFEAYINGSKSSDDLLSTAFTAFDKTVMYLTYDITKFIKSGKNALGVILGNGWYNCFTQDPWNTREASWRHLPKVIAELHIKFADSRENIVITNPSWKSNKSPITFNGIRNGEFYDSRLEIVGWNTAEFDDSNWEGTKIIRGAGGKLRSFELEPIRITKELSPIRKWKTSKGSWLFDIGQNFSGIARIKVSGKVGAEIVLKYSDMLSEDKLNLNQAPIGGFVRSGEFQTDKYIKHSDGVEVWQPKFVYHGFQYVEVYGLDYEPELDTVIGLVMHTDFAQRGTFRCSDELLNSIQKLCYWSTISNFHSIPTDCPHREKNGWTGDASISSEQTLLNFAAMSAYTKWMRDFIDAQRKDGAVPCVVPSTGWGYNWGNGPDWSSALTLIPWNLYVYCGDTEILAELYDSIKKHCGYIESMADNYIVNYGIGDWCAPFDGPALAVNMSTFKAPTTLTDTAYFYNTASTISKIAKILGAIEDEKTYSELAKKIKEAFRKKFFDKENMKIAGDCQTSVACMLYQGLAEEEEKEILLEKLLEKIEEKDFHLDYGILGVKYVMNSLGAAGKGNVGCRMISQKTYPSFKNWLDMGATTLWECWNGGGSHNHHMFSDVSAFMYKYLAGIAPDEKEPGFKHILMRPAFDSELSFVECKHESMYGAIECNWTNINNVIRIDISIPVGCHADLFLPLRFENKIKEISEKEVDGIKAAIRDKELVLSLVSGKYSFSI